MRSLLACVVAVSFAVACDHGSTVVIAAPVTSAPPATSVAPASASDVVLPKSRSTVAPAPDALVVVLSKTRLALGVDGPTLATLDPATAAHGFDAKLKKGGATDHVVVPLSEALAARHVANAVSTPIALRIDQAVPYGAIVDVLFTLGMSGFSKIGFLVDSHAGTAIVNLSLPHALTPAAAKHAYALVLADDGYVVSADTGRLGSDCTTPTSAPGVTIAKVEKGYDVKALAACARLFEERYPDSMQLVSVVVTPQSSTDLQTIMQTIDALYLEGDGFMPAVSLGVSFH